MIKRLALSLGFDACGIARAEALAEDALYLRQWLDEGKQGDMHYLERNFEKRTDPRVLVPGCKAVVAVLLNYYPEIKQIPDAPQIAKYAYSAIDYHAVLKSKLSKLELAICEAFGPQSINANVQHSFVDSAPILERRWAERAGLGWIGKHTLLIHPGLGSYTLIGILLLNIELEYDTPLIPRCGTCTRCINACPTKALQNGSIDARRCISYLTIESKSDIPPEFQSSLSGNALGCDICADSCPWNAKWAKPHAHPELSPNESILQWKWDNWQQLTEKEFNKTFPHSAIKRAGYEKFKYNIDLLSNTHKK